MYPLGLQNKNWFCMIWLVLFTNKYYINGMIL